MSNPDWAHGNRGLRQKQKKRDRLFREYYERHPEAQASSVVVATPMCSYPGRAMSLSDQSLIAAFLETKRNKERAA